MMNKLYKKILKQLIKSGILRIDFSNEEEIEAFFGSLNKKEESQ